MLYIVDFDTHHLFILDKDDNTVEHITYDEFFENYDNLKRYLAGTFFLLDGADSVFDIYSRDNLETSFLGELFAKLDVYNELEYVRRLHNLTLEDYRVSAVSVEIRSYSFISNIHRFNYKKYVCSKINLIYDLIISTNYDGVGFKSLLVRILLDYYCDSMRHFNSVKNLSDGLRYIGDFCNWNIRGRGYVFSFHNSLYAKFFMFSVLGKYTDYISSIDVLGYMDSIFTGIDKYLGKILHITILVDEVYIEFENFKDNVFLTKNKVLRSS